MPVFWELKEGKRQRNLLFRISISLYCSTELPLCPLLGLEPNIQLLFLARTPLSTLIPIWLLWCECLLDIGFHFSFLRPPGEFHWHENLLSIFKKFTNASVYCHKTEFQEGNKIKSISFNSRCLHWLAKDWTYTMEEGVSSSCYNKTP